MTRNNLAALGATNNSAAGGQAATKGNNNMTTIEEPTTAGLPQAPFWRDGVDPDGLKFRPLFADYFTIGLEARVLASLDRGSVLLTIVNGPDSRPIIADPVDELARVCASDCEIVDLPGTMVRAFITMTRGEGGEGYRNQACFVTPDGTVTWMGFDGICFVCFSERLKEDASRELPLLINNVWRAVFAPELLPDHWRAQQN